MRTSPTSRPPRRRTVVTLAGLASLVVAGGPACDQAKVTGGSSGAGGTGGFAPGGSGGTGGRGGSSDGPAFEVTAPADVPPAVDSGGAGELCAEDAYKAERVPVDLFLLIDASDSMASAGAGSMMNKYQLVRQALLRFARDPGSAGLGLGLQFFPLPGPGSSCQSDRDCGYVVSPTTPPCQPVRACADSVAAGQTRACPSSGMCPGSTCVPLGRCSKSFADCTNVGQPCAGGMAGDSCVGFGSTCSVVTDLAGCSPALYEQPFVPITQLPAPGERLVTWGLGVRYPSGGTPLRAAVEGALVHLRRHLGEHPGRKGVMVLASDGAPSPGCANNTVADAAALLSRARVPAAPAPAIDTYVIGVYTPADMAERTALETLATAGGTGTPLVIGPTEDLNQRFFETLNRIRGQALPCELVIPPPKPGAAALDFNKVNLRFRGSAMGMTGPEDVLYAGSAARCDPQRGGWYYDVDPAMGTPTRIIVCEATCRRWKADPAATVDLGIGCRTRVID
jgi:hypothetical protein